MIIVGASFYYTNILVNKMANEERKQVQLWAGAIQNKAQLVSYTSTLFQKMENEERKKVELWVEATKSLVNSNPNTNVSLALEVVQNNTTIPIILVNEKGEISLNRNIEGYLEISKDSLKQLPQQQVDSINTYNHQLLEKELAIMTENFEPIEFSYFGKSTNYLYYKESKLVEELRNTFNDLQNSFIQEIVSNSASTPVLYVNADQDSVIASGNIETDQLLDSTHLSQTMAEMKSENDPILVDLGEGKTSYIFYKDSELLNQLKYYPLVQFLVIGLFILIGYWLFSISRKSEQNQVWVGMSKETAHQLGTPLSSLMGWIELLKAKDIDPSITSEMNKDIHRLEMITDRFSKIGAKPKLETQNVVDVIEHFVAYLKTRSPRKVNFKVVNKETHPVNAQLNVPLFEWVIENLCKNAIDAMEGNGNIEITIEQKDQKINIEVSDTGKGIPPGKRKAVFQPGYTSKKRGWGLGLSLSKRIIENYHRGKISVKSTEAGKGTTFKIVLNA